MAETASPLDSPLELASLPSMLCTQSGFWPELRRVKVMATRTAFCPGRSTAVTLSIDPAPCGLARWKNDAMPTRMSIPAVAMRRILTGGRLRLAVPNSSPMSMVGPVCAAGTVSAGAIGVAGGSGAGFGIGSDITLFRAFGLYSQAGLSIPLMFHGLAELFHRQGIEHVVFGQPGAARLQNAVADFF